MNFLETLIQSAQRSLSLLFQCTLFLMFPLCQKYLNHQVRTNKLVNSVLYHPCLLRLASRIHISLKSFEIYLFPECLLVIDLSPEYFTTCGKHFSVYGVRIPRKCIESMHFHSWSSLRLKCRGIIFWKSVSHMMKGVEKTMICLIKIQSKKKKMTWNIGLFIFCMSCIFSKCDGFTVLWIISIK